MSQEAVRESAFVQSKAEESLRVTCYGSSSSATPDTYMREAWDLGYILAKRGHTCVNGAGAYGCMASMNDGAIAGNGHIVGVIHEMWLVDQGDWQSTRRLQLRDGTHEIFTAKHEGSGPIREMIVAKGDNLQERKRLLVDQAQALIVLPGGPGTWDELWEMACIRKLGLPNAVPICCVDVSGFYQPFLKMLQRAHDDKLLEQEPSDIINFVPTAEDAVRWAESIQAEKHENIGKTEKRIPESHVKPFAATLLIFVAGLGFGVFFGRRARTA